MTHNFPIPKTHPRAASLRIRDRLVQAWRNGVVADAGLMAHGRGEAFDYLIGEQTIPQASKAISAAAALLCQSKYPVISVNGNAAALCADELVELAESTGSKLEVNLFYRTEERAAKIVELLRRKGAKQVLNVASNASETLPGLKSARGKVARLGIAQADTVLVPLEDGDRSIALGRMGKNVIAIDLNPLSRTARSATITIVDNMIRALPLLVAKSKRISELPQSRSRTSSTKFDNQENLKNSVNFITRRLNRLSRKGLLLEVS